MRTTGYKDGTRFHEAMIDGWSRGFQPEQCIQELREIGYEVDEDFILMFHLQHGQGDGNVLRTSR